MRPTTRPSLASRAGFSLTELMVAMAITTIVMGVTMAGLADVSKGNEMVMTISAMNNALRAGTDLLIRDLLQAASGLPASHVVSIPHGVGSQRIRIPGPPGSDFQLPANQEYMSAVMPMNGAGPVIDGVATDIIAVLMADNAFDNVPISAITNTQVTIPPPSAAGVQPVVPNITTGADRVVAGQLMMISKLSVNTLVQVTSVDYGTRTIRFVAGDSLRLNQPAAESGNLTALNNEDPIAAGATMAQAVAATRISRVRMIAYYLDATTDPLHPRLVRRVNNGHWQTFNNDLGTAVSLDVFDMQFNYDIVNGTNNPGGVSMSAADLGTGGACAPDACSETQIRKVGLRLTARAPNRISGGSSFMTNSLESQVSLRAMAFVDRFRE